MARDISEPHVSIYLSICHANDSAMEDVFTTVWLFHPSCLRKALMLKVNDTAHGRVKRAALGFLSQFSRAFGRRPCAQLAPHQTHSTSGLVVHYSVCSRLKG